MKIVIQELDKLHINDVGKSNGEFRIDSKLVLHAEDNKIRYTIVKVPSYTKRYDADQLDYTAYIDNPDKTIFLAYTTGQIAGHIILRRNWNRYAYIEDIVVDVSFRRKGIGKALIEKAKQWAHARDLPGIMLETQNNNVPACLLYERCGFQLSGFDTHLYKGIKPETDEVALYWYFVF